LRNDTIKAEFPLRKNSSEETFMNNRTSLLSIGIALVGFALSPASAACLDEIASLSPGTTSGPAAGPTGTAAPGRVSKDGTMAPLQTGSTAPAPMSPAPRSAGQSSTSGQSGVAKDGSTMPLANTPGGGDKNLATSQQDVQAQQKSGQAAAAAAQAGNAMTPSSRHSPEMMAALDKARTLQAQGNEAGCLQAVQDAKRLTQ